MAKLTRKLLKPFGSAGATSQFGEFGSLAAGAPVTTKDVETIQSLSNWLSGWFSAIEGSNYPAIEDMNAFCYVLCYQLCYLMQAGIAEWNLATTYYIGSLVNDGTGLVYASLTDNNLNNVLTDISNWKVNGKKLSTAQFVVGSAAEVMAGYADYSTVASALTANPTNVSLLISQNYSTVEDVTLGAAGVSIEGQNPSSTINGNLILNSSYCKVYGVKITGNITLSGSSAANFITNSWISVNSNAIDNGVNNKLEVIQN